MSDPCARARIPWSVDNNERSRSCEGQIECSAWMGDSHQRQGHKILFGVCKLLSPGCSRLCKYCSPTHHVDKKGCPLALGSPTTQGFCKSQICPMHCTTPNLSRSITSVHSSVRCFWRCCWRSIDVGPRRRPATSSIYKPSIQTYKIAVLGIWKGVGYSRILLYSMAPLLGRLSWGCHGGDRL